MTRYIDILLHEAGWPLDRRSATASSRSTACPIARARASSTTCSGATTACRSAWSRPSAPGETRKSAAQQAKLYADCLEAALRPAPGDLLHQRLRDVAVGRQALSAPRVQGFYTKDELALLDQSPHLSPASSPTWTINSAIVERHYQHRAIRRIGETFERDNQRKALVVMATGAGKTRTMIALIDLLMRAGWVKTRAVPRRPDRTREPDGRRVQDASAGLDHGEPRDRAQRGRPRLRLDLSDDDGADRRRAARGRSGASARASSTSS